MWDCQSKAMALDSSRTPEETAADAKNHVTAPARASPSSLRSSAPER